MPNYFFSKSQSSFYVDALPQNMPPDSISISEATYTALLADINAGGELKVDGNGQPIVTPQPDAFYSRQVRGRIYVYCQQLSPNNTSDLMRYQARYLQAIAYKSAGYPTPLPVEFEPFLKETAQWAGITARELANNIIAEHMILETILSKADGICEKAKAQLPTVTTIAQKNAMVEQLAAEMKTFIETLGFSVSEWS